jgi:hypothetical protein
MMSATNDRLEAYKQTYRSTPSNEDSFRPVKAMADIDCAIAIQDALTGLTTAINKATTQAAISSAESTNAAHESANLSRKLNMLTFWIVLAAIISAGAAGVQAWAAWYNAHHPQQPAVLVSSPTAPASPASPSGTPAH